MTKRFESTSTFGVLSAFFSLFRFLRRTDVFAVIHGRGDAFTGDVFYETCFSSNSSGSRLYKVFSLVVLICGLFFCVSKHACILLNLLYINRISNFHAFD
jgi:hypothetical protein